MNKRTYRILIATLALLLPLFLLQSTGAKREDKGKRKPAPSSVQSLVKNGLPLPGVSVNQSLRQSRSQGKKVTEELKSGSIKDEGGQDEINVDKMSSAGRLAHLAATGELSRAIEKARSRAEGRAARTSGKNAQALALSEEDDSEEGDDDEGEGPAGGQAELSVAVDSTGQHIVVGLNDTRGFSSNPVSVSGFAYSDDGGATFVDGGQLPSPGTDLIGATRFPQIFGDPEVKYLGGSNFIYFSIMLKKFTATGTAQTMCVHRSTDFGHTWTGPFEIPPVTNPHGLLSGVNARDAADKEFADVDPDTGRVILSWSNFTSTAFAAGGIEISTTFSDNIMSATPPTWSARQILGNTAADGQASIPRFAGNGSTNAYVAWRRFPGGNNQNVGFSRSTNNGASWSAPVNLTTNFFTMDYVLGNDRPNTSPALAVDNSGGPNQGTIYVVYGNNNNHDGLDIAFQRSLDGGLTFSAPILLDSRPGSDRTQWFPWVNVDKTTGRVYVFYYDQGIASSGDLTETTFVFSDNAGVTWSKPMPLTDRPFHAGWGNDTGQPNLGDYNQAVAQGGELFVVWAGTELKGFADGQPSASMTTPDVFFKRAPAVKTSLDLGAVTFTDGNANGFIDAGEQVHLKMPLRNYVTNPLSAGTVTGIIGTLSTTTPGVTVTQATSTYPVLAPGASAPNDTDYVLQLSPGFVKGTHIELALNVSSAQGTNNLLFTQSTGTPGPTVLLSENFNAVAPGALPAGWAPSHGGGANTVPWTTNNTFFGTTSNAAFHQNANDGVGGTGNPTRFERLFSPAFVVPATAEYVTVDMDVVYDTEDDPSFNILAYDGFLLRITDGTAGRTLRSLLAEAIEEELTTGNIQHYPKHFPRNSSSAYFEDMSAWAGDSQGFKHVHMKFPGPGGLAGALIQLRFEFAQDSSATCANVRPGHQCGVMFDNLVVQSVVSVQADLSITKTASPDPVITGNNVTYTITARNNGPNTANSVVVTDNLPSSVSFVSCSSTGGGVCGGSGNNRTVTFASLASGASETITLVATVDCSLADNTSIINTASIGSATPDNDSSNNSATATVKASNPAPVISCPANREVSNDPGLCSATVDPGSATATDNCPGVIVTGSRSDARPLTDHSYPVGTTTITWTATDSGGNSSSCTQSITVKDTEKPTIACPADIAIVDNAPGSCGANVNPGAPTTSDNCGVKSVAGQRSDGKALNDLYPVGTTTITWTATDYSNNEQSCQQTVTVTNPAPVIVITGPTVPQAVNTPVNFTATFTDNAGDLHTAVWTFDGSPQAGAVDESAHTVTATHTFTTVGFHAVSVTITDDCGQTGSANSTILIYGPVGNGTGNFVIGDGNSAVGTHVTFWGAQWAKLNSLSGGAAPSSFVGFANSTSTHPPTCGGTWTSDPGNSSGPPSSVPEYIAVIASSSISKSGSIISGNNRKIVVVKTEPGYDANPGHAGTGTVVAVICQ